MEEPASTVGNPYFDYRKLLDSISTRLHKENALRLANLYSLPSWYFEIGPSHDPSYALRVLIAMEGKGVFAPGNLKGLIEALKTIQREDLCTTVKDFVKLKYEQGVSQERMRRLTHPQEAETHPPSYPKPRPSSNIVYCGMSSASPQLFHSTSLSSIAVEGGIEEIEETDGLRCRSRPNLNHFLKGIETTVDSSNNIISQSPSELRHGPYKSISPDSIQLVLLSAQSLVKQLEVLSSNALTPSGPKESTPAEDSDQKLLSKSMAAAKRMIQCLHSLSDRHTEAMGRHFSHSGSYTTDLSRMSSLGSETAAVERDLLLDSIRNEPAAVFSDSKSKSKGASLKHKSSLSAPRPGSMHPMQVPHSQDFTSSATANPAPLALSHPTPNFTTRGRRRSRKEDKKLNKRGILVWNVKVKKLKNLIGQLGSKIESEELYDFSKRPLRAALHPHGLGEDIGNHMTLTIHCLEEPKSSTLPNLEIVVNVIDPHSDAKAPMVSPIRRSLERRGIRLVQQFLAHSMVDSFKCSYITITVAIVGKQVDSEDSETGDV